MKDSATMPAGILDSLRRLDKGSVTSYHALETGDDIKAIRYSLAEAKKAREYACSYRNFRVGAAALVAGYFEGAEYVYWVHGANYKPSQSGQDGNVHAEDIVMQAVDALQQQHVEARVRLMTIVGDYQPDPQSGAQTRTLHPCGLCRDNMQQRAEAFKDTTYLTALPTLRTLEWFSLSQLVRYHDAHGRANLDYCEFPQHMAEHGTETDIQLTNRTMPDVAYYGMDQ